MTTENQDFEQTHSAQVIGQETPDNLSPEHECAQNRTVDEPQSDFAGAGEVDASPEKKDKRETPDMSGTMFKNDRKSKDSHPDITGSAMIFGQEFYVSGWRKAGAKGDFYSLSFRVKDISAKASDLI